MNTIKGSIKLIEETKEYGANGFTKRQFILTTDEKYPQEVKLELYKDDCDLLDAYSTGDSIEATFNIKGNEYKGNYYVNLQAWKMKLLEEDSPQEENKQSTKKKVGRPKKEKEPELADEDLTENISELADAPF